MNTSTAQRRARSRTGAVLGAANFTLSLYQNTLLHKTLFPLYTTE